ncbi:MAG TPA: hypothetical protein PLY93_04485 [Turneriella sp.]|nr:hypothetical protein [Turneriella sp.]
MQKRTLIIALTIVFTMIGCAFQNGDDDIIGSKRADNVRDLSLIEARNTIAPTTSTVQFDKTKEAVKEVQVGDVIVSDVNGKSPNGFLKKVVNVVENAQDKIIVTEETSITEAVEEGQASAEGILNPAGDNSLLTGATYNQFNGQIETITPEPGVTVYGTKKPGTLPPEIPSNCSQAKAKRWYVEFDKTIQSSGTIKGCVGMDLAFKLNMKIKWFKLKSAEFSLAPSLITEIKTNLNGNTFDINRAQVTLTTFNLQPITFTIGFVPVVIIPRIKIVLGVDGKVTATLVSTFQFEASAKAGIVYADSKWSVIKERSSKYNFNTPVFTGNINAMVYAGPEVTLLFYGIVGPGANLYAYTHFNVDWDAGLNKPKRWDIWLGVEAGAHFTVEMFGRTLFKINEPSILGYEWLVASSDFWGIAPPGTGNVTGVLGSRLNGTYTKSDNTSSTMSGDLITVGNLVGTLAKK